MVRQVTAACFALSMNWLLLLPICYLLEALLLRYALIVLRSSAGLYKGGILLILLGLAIGGWLTGVKYHATPDLVHVGVPIPIVFNQLEKDGWTTFVPAWSPFGIVANLLAGCCVASTAVVFWAKVKRLDVRKGGG